MCVPTTKSVSKMFLQILLLLTISAGDRVDYSGYQVWRIRPVSNPRVRDPSSDASSSSSSSDAATPDLLSRLEEITQEVQQEIGGEGGKLETEAWGDGEIVVSRRARELVSKRLREAGLSGRVVLDDLEEAIEQERNEVEENTEETEEGDKRKVKFDLERYHDLEEIDQYLKDLERSYPDLVSLDVIGESLEGRNMTVLKICNKGCGIKPVMWINSGIHAREWISPATGLFLIDRLVQTLPEEDSDILTLLDWYFLPVLNPDGYVFTRDVDRLWRKNRRPNDNSTCLGVDLNRNFPVGFGDDAGSSPDPCSQTFRGPSAFSEPELANMREYIRELNDLPEKEEEEEGETPRGRVAYYQDVHSYGQLILYPWGHREGFVDDIDDILTVGTKANEALKAVHDTDYRLGPVFSMLYPASGIAVDWAYGEENIKYSYTLELRPNSFFAGGFILPADEIREVGEEIYAFHLVMAREMIREHAVELLAKFGVVAVTGGTEVNNKSSGAGAGAGTTGAGAGTTGSGAGTTGSGTGTTGSGTGTTGSGAGTTGAGAGTTGVGTGTTGAGTGTAGSGAAGAGAAGAGASGGDGEGEGSNSSNSSNNSGGGGGSEPVPQQQEQSQPPRIPLGD